MKKIVLITLILIACTLHAQEDSFQENDFLDSPDMIQPPPPPPTDSFNNGNDIPTYQPPADNSFSPSASSGSSKGSGFGSISKKRTTTKKPSLSQATDADITNENYPDLIESFDFPNADIADVIKAISELTGKNFIVDPSVSGKITIMAPTQITVAEAYKVFLSALAIRGFAVVPSGKFLKILPVRDAQRDNIDIYSGAYTPDSDQMITRIIHLRYVPASEMNKFASKLVSKNGNIDIYEPTNSLIVSDQASSVQRILKIVAQLDVSSFDEQLAVIPIRYAKAKDIADLISQIINKGDKKNTGGFNAGIPRFRPGSSNSSSGSSAYSTVIPDDRTNSIIVVGNKDGIDKIKKLVATLDTKHAIQAGAYVYYVKYGEAEKIADILNGIAKSLKDDQKTNPTQNPGYPPPPVYDSFGSPFAQNQSSGNSSQGSSGLFGADVKISADKETNALIIVGSKQDYLGVLALLNKIDVARDQVFVQTVIMEMNVDDKNTYGLAYYKFGDGGSSGMVPRVGFGGGVDPTKAMGLGSVGSDGAILGFGTGSTVSVAGPNGSTVQVKSLLGLLNLIRQTTKSDVLATPQIIAMDNQKAVVEVGSQVPVGLSTSNTTGAGGAALQSVDKVDATIKLEIKPYISPSSESVRMEIKQTIKQVGGAINDSATSLSAISRSVDQRAIETNLVVRDGDTAVLGGLMKNSETVDVTKVPLLGDIPVLGWLFKSQQTKIVKNNLIVFITPKVIRNPEDSNKLLTKKLDERLRYVKDTGGVDKFGADAENLRPKASSAKRPVIDEKNDDNNDDEFIE